MKFLVVLVSLALSMNLQAATAPKTGSRTASGGGHHVAPKSEAGATNPAPRGSAVSPSGGGKQAKHIIESVPDTGQFLADTAVLARVNDRVITVYDFRDRYYSSLGEYRPKPDSAGRAEFLDRMIDKDVMALLALKIDRPLEFEDRTQLRRETSTALENVLFKRMVSDSVGVTEQEIRQLFPQFKYEQHIRSIYFVDRETAVRVRAALLRGSLSWREAVQKYSLRPPKNPDGDEGWVKRTQFTGQAGILGFDLKPGATSEIIEEEVEGFRLIQCVGRRPVPFPGETFTRMQIANDLRKMKRAPYVRRFYERVRDRAGVVYDSTNIRYVVGKFRKEFDVWRASGSSSIDFAEMMPEFTSEDSARVLAKTRTRQITLGQFISDYRTIPAVFRSKLLSFEPFVYTFDGPALEPERIELAREAGIENDSLTRLIVGRRKEQLLVEHLYQDSVVNRINVSPEMRRKYYQQHEKEFVTTPEVRYARFLCGSKAHADSLVARLRSGEKAEHIIEKNSAMGDDSTGAIAEIRETDHDRYKKILFEELRPGMVTTVGPDPVGAYLVLQSIRYSPTRQLPYEEVQNIVDESVQNIESERLLKEFVARHRLSCRIEWHPERLPHVRLTDPVMDVNTQVQ